MHLNINFKCPFHISVWTQTINDPVRTEIMEPYLKGLFWILCLAQSFQRYNIYFLLVYHKFEQLNPELKQTLKICGVNLPPNSFYASIQTSVTCCLCPMVFYWRHHKYSHIHESTTKLFNFTVERHCTLCTVALCTVAK